MEAKSCSAASFQSLWRAGKEVSLASSLGEGWGSGGWLQSLPRWAVALLPPYPTSLGVQLPPRALLPWPAESPSPLLSLNCRMPPLSLRGVQEIQSPLSSQLRHVFMFQMMETLSCSRRLSGASRAWVFRDVATAVVGKQGRGLYYNERCGPCFWVEMYFI